MGRTDCLNPGDEVHQKKGYNDCKHFAWGFELYTVTFAPELQQKTRPFVTPEMYVRVNANVLTNSVHLFMCCG